MDDLTAEQADEYRGSPDRPGKESLPDPQRGGESGFICTGCATGVPGWSTHFAGKDRHDIAQYLAA